MAKIDLRLELDQAELDLHPDQRTHEAHVHLAKIVGDVVAGLFLQADDVEPVEAWLTVGEHRNLDDGTCTVLVEAAIPVPADDEAEAHVMVEALISGGGNRASLGDDHGDLR